MEENGKTAVNGKQKKNNSDDTRPSVALIIGSEGIKSFCALPYIEYLKEQHVNLDLIIGVSGGALLAGFMGAGYNLRQIQEVFSKTVDPRFFTDIDYNAVLDIARTGMGKFTAESGILKTDCLRRTYNAVFKDTDISDLSPKTLISTTDLSTGKPVILDKGNLAQSIYASGAIYPLMPPGVIDGKKLIDGAFSAPVPVMECVKRKIDIIIAIYFDDACKTEPESFIESYFNTSRIFKRSILTSQLPLSIDLHHHEIIPVYIKHPRPIDLWEINKLNEIVHSGKVALSNHKGQVKNAISEFRIKAQRLENDQKERKAAKNKPEESAEKFKEEIKSETKVERKINTPVQTGKDAPKRKIKIIKSSRERRGSGT